MDTNKASSQLVAACHDFDMFESREVIRKIEEEAKQQYSNNKKDALQWLAELREQRKGLAANKQMMNGPLLPQTPTMKRKLRKRKIPPVEDAEKENNAITRSHRAASQAANSKFYDQLHVPLKLRRPSAPRKVSYVAKPRKARAAKKMRVRLEEPSSEDSEDDMEMSTVSTATEPGEGRTLRNNTEALQPDLTLTKTSSAAEPPQGRARRQKKGEVKYPEENKEKSSAEANKRCLRARNNKANATQASVPSDDEEEALKETPPVVETAKPKCKETLDKPLPEAVVETVKIKQERLSILEEDCSQQQRSANYEAKDMEISMMPPHGSADILITQTLQISLNRLPANLGTSVMLTPQGSIVVPDSDDETLSAEEDMEMTVAAPKTPLLAGASSNAANLQAAVSVGPDLVALTPHLKGRVMERVIAVERSLQKEEPRSAVLQAKKGAQKRKADSPPNKESLDLFESAESSPEKHDSPTYHAGRAKKSGGPPARKSHKRSTTAPRIIVKLFDKQSFPTTADTFDQLMASTSKGGRSRVLTGVRTFIKPSAREQAQVAAAGEEKRRRAEELQKNLERAQDAARKKEEHLRLKTEQKKRENEEKRLRAQMAQEARAREQEEAARQEREREERQAAQQRLREEKELADKVLRREQRLLKQAEREQRRKDEELKAKIRAREIAAAAALEVQKRDDDRRADAAKGGWTAPSAKPHVAPKPPAAPKNTMNETFEVPSKATTKEKNPGTLLHKAVAAVAASSSSANSYALTPSRDEVPPASPKNLNNYGIDDVKEDDPSDDDEKPKKRIPEWARGLATNLALHCADYVSISLRNSLFGTSVFKPTMQELFGENARPLARRSSAIWNTPPNVFHQSFCLSPTE